MIFNRKEMVKKENHNRKEVIKLFSNFKKNKKFLIKIMNF